MVDDDKLSGDLNLLTNDNDRNSPVNSTSLNGIDFDSTIDDLLSTNLFQPSGNSEEQNPFIESTNGYNDVEAESSPKVYIAPRVMINHQDSFSIDSQIDYIEDARILPSSPGAMQEDPIALPRLRVPGSPSQGFVLPKPAGSPRFDSPKGVESPIAPALIDTAAPFESVKEAVSKFGGITDWKAHKIQTIERRKTVDQELEKIQEDTSEYKKQAIVAEEAKQHVLMELERTRSVIEELKLELDKAEKEEQQAKQDSELAMMRVEEMEQGIADEVSVAAKAQLEVATTRHLSAVSELQSVRQEIEMVSKEYEDMLTEKEVAVKKAEDSNLEAKDIEKKMESLTIELIATKKLMESAHTAHLEADERKLSAAMSRDHEIYSFEKELKMVEDEIERFNQEINATDDVKTKLEAAYVRQHDLRAEIAAYMENTDGGNIQAAVDSARKELEQVKTNIEKATSEVKNLKITVGSLQSEIEREKKDIVESKEREARWIQKKEQEEREVCTEIAKKLLEAAMKAEEAKSFATSVREELRKAKEESDEAKTGLSKIENQLVEVKKEMEAARASERLALAAIKALQETESNQKFDDVTTPRSIIISVEEYYELSKKAHEVEEVANRRLAEIVSQIEVAKEEESRILEKLEEVNREIAMRKEQLRTAMVEVEKARDGKVGADHELRKWRSEKSPEMEPKLALYKPRSFAFGEQGSSNVGVGDNNNNITPETKKKKKKFSILPKVFMFLSRKKTHK